VRFTGAVAADKDYVFTALDKAAAGQLQYQRFVELLDEGATEPFFGSSHATSPRLLKYWAPLKV
jgi:hypothetical protein